MQPEQAKFRIPTETFNLATERGDEKTTIQWNALSERHKQATLYTQNRSLKYEKAQQLCNIANHGNVLEKWRRSNVWSVNFTTAKIVFLLMGNQLLIINKNQW